MLNIYECVDAATEAMELLNELDETFTDIFYDNPRARDWFEENYKGAQVPILAMGGALEVCEMFVNEFADADDE